MQYRLLLLFVLFTFSISAQKDMSIDLISSFDYTGVSNSGSGITNVQRKGIYTYRIGVNFNFRIYEKVMFKSGLRFATLGSNFYSDNLRWGSQIQIGQEPTFPDPSLPTMREAISKHRYIEIPFILRYEFETKKFQPYIEFGMSTHFYRYTKSILKTNIETSVSFADYNENIADFNSTQFAAVLSFGFNYNITGGSQLFAQPTYRINLNKSSDNSNASRFYSLGLEFGVRKLFGSYFTKPKV